MRRDVPMGAAQLPAPWTVPRRPRTQTRRQRRAGEPRAERNSQDPPIASRERPAGVGTARRTGATASFRRRIPGIRPPPAANAGVSRGWVRLRRARGDRGARRSGDRRSGVPATTYSPTALPLQYHRRWRTLLPCSEWERVWPLRSGHRDKNDPLQSVEASSGTFPDCGTSRCFACSSVGESIVSVARQFLSRELLIRTMWSSLTAD